jgi:hypothetical protein
LSGTAVSLVSWDPGVPMSHTRVLISSNVGGLPNLAMGGEELGLGLGSEGGSEEEKGRRVRRPLGILSESRHAA